MRGRSLNDNSLAKPDDLRSSEDSRKQARVAPRARGAAHRGEVAIARCDAGPGNKAGCGSRSLIPATPDRVEMTAVREAQPIAWTTVPLGDVAEVKLGKLPTRRRDRRKAR